MALWSVLLLVHTCHGFLLPNHPKVWQPLWASEPTTSSSLSETSIALGREQLAHRFDFPLDDWQLAAGGELIQGHNVIVCAPTGSGKTVVGEMALWIAAVDRQLSGIYTTPLKALSNQKYAELKQIFERTKNEDDSLIVGLATGDMSINRQTARITVMTTEVYRNIAWRASGRSDEEDKEPINTDSSMYIKEYQDLQENAVVVFDEFHYMGVPGRGSVWEESVITSPKHTQIVALSATLPNAAQLADWMQGVTGRKTVLVEAPTARPVPLSYMYATREGLFPLFAKDGAGPGSPLGLLGYRGDYGSQPPKFPKEINENKIPKGLKVNPMLKAAAQRRVQRVNKKLQELKTRSNQIEDFSLDLDNGRGGGRRSRKILPYPKKMSAREERKERERLLKRELRKSVPSLSLLLKRLQKQDLLPAIFFIFSRAGCDNAAQTVVNHMKGLYEPDDNNGGEDDDGDEEYDKPRRFRKTRNQRDERGLARDQQGRKYRVANGNMDESVIDRLARSSSQNGLKYNPAEPMSPSNFPFISEVGLLSPEQVYAVAEKCQKFNEENTEIAFSTAISEQFLFGIGSHHAGMLPAHKAFVEQLYRGGLMKAVFATETLAAGINMPMRTSVICALAKRSDGGGMALLETSNLLQMSGRAGRRGMDTEGTCVVLATAFETEEDAATILINPVKPIASQFRPSYSLAINLIFRGQGRLNVAKDLVSKSFAVWEQRKNAVPEDADFTELMEVSSQERVIISLQNTMETIIRQRNANYDIGKLQSLVALIKDKEALKKSSKSYIGLGRLFELEDTTLKYMEMEINDRSDKDEEFMSLEEQMEVQRNRLRKAAKDLQKHPFQRMANIANQLLQGNSTEANDFKEAVRLVTATEEESSRPEPLVLSPEDLSNYAKSAVVMKRKLRKLSKDNPGISSEDLLLQTQESDDEVEASWGDLVSIIKVLKAYGCVQTDAVNNDEDFENSQFNITVAGSDVGLLGFDNSLWCFVAMGGTYDVEGVSSEMDEFKLAMDALESNWFDEDNDASTMGTDDLYPEKKLEGNAARNEVNDLVRQLRDLLPEELAGYVSCLVAEGSRSSYSVVDSFQQMLPRQQRVVQSSLLVMERLVDVQRVLGVDGQKATLDVGNCPVVTAWAAGCSWSEAVEMSGVAPGDLARTLSRSLDALRQFGNLPYRPLRKEDMADDGDLVDPFERSIHPEVRRLCREAAEAMNRYPLKDPLPFEEEVEDGMFEEDDEDETGETVAEGTFVQTDEQS